MSEEIAGSLKELIAVLDRDRLAQAEKTGEDEAISKIVDHLIAQAVQMKATDIHIEPEENALNLRYRIDGMLSRQPPLPKDLIGAIISRLKSISSLDIAEKKLPQEGRILRKVDGKEIDFRVSTCPTLHGENVVLKVLDKSGMIIGLEELGFSPTDLKLFQGLIGGLSYGIILVTGPTGSGKTTTLYSALQLLNKEDVNIMTVEDPVEYQFTGMRQVHVNTKAGLGFATALRSFLRQDPDIIMVGEVRDRETAEIAVQAALTGHLVFSTLHTNDSAAAFTRLIDMGIEPFLASSSILAILAQRLVRRVCEQCRQDYTPTAEVLKSLGIEPKPGEPVKFSRGQGCKFCNQSGYKGRIGIYELLKVSPAIQEMVLKRASIEDIAALAVKGGMKNLRQAAIDKLLAGLTTPQEVLRVTMDPGD